MYHVGWIWKNKSLWFGEGYIIPQLRLQTWFGSCFPRCLVCLGVSVAAPDAEAVKDRPAKAPPPVFHTFQHQSVRRKTPSWEVTTLWAIYQREQWADFIELTDATLVVIAAALVPTYPQRETKGKQVLLNILQQEKAGTDLQKSSSLLKHILCGQERAHALWPWGAPNASLTNWMATWTSFSFSNSSHN